MIEGQKMHCGKDRKPPSRFKIHQARSLSLSQEEQHTKLFSLTNSGAAARGRRAVNSRWVIKINSHDSLSSQQGQTLERNWDNAQTDK